MSDEYGQQWSSAPAEPEEPEEPSAPPADEEETWGEQVEAAWDEFTDQVEETWDAAVETVQETWAEVRGGDGPTEGGVLPDAGADFRLRTDFELQLLGADPRAAAASWGELTEAERARVIEFMSGIFGAAFAQEFVSTPTDLGIDLDDIRNIAPSQVEAQGFRYIRTDGNFQIYYRPSGRMFQLKVFWDEGEDEPEVLVQAREECDHLDALLANVRSLADTARNRRGAHDYAVAFCRLYRAMMDYGHQGRAASARSKTWSADPASVPGLAACITRIDGHVGRVDSGDHAREIWNGLPSPVDADGNFVDCDRVLADAGE